MAANRGSKQSVVVAALAVLLTVSMTVCAALDATADRVLGQTSLTTGLANQGGSANAGTLNGPYGPRVDHRTGRIYVADGGNNRVLSWSNAASFANGASADLVLGQPNFTSAAVPNPPTASSLNFPLDVAIDTAGNVYVSDFGNNRVLVFKDPVNTDKVADYVIGQTDFVSRVAAVTDHNLNGPYGLALDGDNNLYVADFNSNRVLLFDRPTWQTLSATAPAASNVWGQGADTTLAGNFTTFGFAATDRGLRSPAGVAIDGTDLYVADSANNRVLRFPGTGLTGGIASAVFGQTNYTNSGFGTTPTTLNLPYAPCLDLLGNLYVVDRLNHRVVVYNPPFAATNDAADAVIGQPDLNTGLPGTTPTTLNNPKGIAIDGYGTIFVSDYGNNRVLAYAQTPTNPVPSVDLVMPAQIVVGSGDFTLYVEGSGFTANTIVRWNGADRPTTYLGASRLKVAMPAADVAVEGSPVLTAFNPTPGGGRSNLKQLGVYKAIPLDQSADHFQGTPGDPLVPTIGDTMDGRTFVPAGIAVDPNTLRLWVCDLRGNRVLSWPNLATLANGQSADFVLGQPDLYDGAPNNGGVSARSLDGPRAVAVDSAGNVYVADSFNHRVLEYNNPIATDTIADRVFGQGGSFTANVPNNAGPVSASGFVVPSGVALDPAGNLYVSDQMNNRVLEFDQPLTTDGVADRVFGQIGSFTTNLPNNGGPVSANGLLIPWGVAVDSSGRLYVADMVNSRVLEFDTPLTSSTANRVFGQNNDFTTTVPSVSATGLTIPQGVAVDAAGNLYIADTNAMRVLEYDNPAVNGTTADRVFGQGGDFTSAGISFPFFPNVVGMPYCIATDSHGDLLVGDMTFNRLLIFDKPVNIAHTLGSQPTATPNPGYAGQSLTFSVSVINPDADVLAYAWTFGDGTTGTGATPTHAYAVPGAYSVSVVITDGYGASVTGACSVTVAAPIFGSGVDTDGDGFSDSAEIALGASPTDPLDSPAGPAGAGAPQLLVVTKAGLRLSFAKPASDSISFTGTLPVPVGFAPTGKKVGVDVGGAVAGFTLDAKAASKSAAGTMKIAIKPKATATQNAKYAIKLNKGDFAAKLVDENLTGTAKNRSVTVVYTIVFNGAVYQKAQTMSYSGVAGKGGAAK